ncbi:energy transducer TonB [Adhaeribacter soli]|uniref:Energy transducer TonB n=1 Tax=Adhaeribacter soli TaxID=2607655 RepID=A0A5N1IJK1_9BACT|nr:energy transducer TonB [Adhaeribacter soli]KAA9325449.1 energy transducer TonB [Adhaeribacter soli]
MKTINYASASLDDIVFEGRNHAYGAYLLRKTYHQHLERGFLAAISVFMLLIAIPLVKNQLFPQPFVIEPQPVQPGTSFIEIELPDIKPVTPPVDQPLTPPQKIETTKFTTPVVTATITKPSEIPTQQALSQTNVGTTTQTGDKEGIAPIETPVAGTAPALPAANTEVLTHAEQMPEFPGGYAALQKYLSSEMRYPALASRNNVEGTVILSFVVNALGEISDIQVLKSLGAGTDEEAKRVIKSMPRWNPGKNNGIAVNVRFVIPVRFALK